MPVSLIGCRCSICTILSDYLEKAYEIRAIVNVSRTSTAEGFYARTGHSCCTLLATIMLIRKVGRPMNLSTFLSFSKFKAVERHVIRLSALSCSYL